METPKTRKKSLVGWIIIDGYGEDFWEVIEGGFLFYKKVPYYTSANPTHIKQVRITIEEL